MFEAQVEEDRSLTFARSETDGNGDARDYLKTGRKVESSANSRCQYQRIASLTSPAVENLVGAVPRQLQHEVERGAKQPDQALSRVEARRRGFVARGVSGRRRMGCPGVQMRDERPRQPRADRQVELCAGGT